VYSCSSKPGNSEHIKKKKRSSKFGYEKRIFFQPDIELNREKKGIKDAYVDMLYLCRRIHIDGSY